MAKKRNGDYMSVTEVAEKWRVSPATVIRMIHSAQITGLKIRGHYRISRQSVDTHEQRRRGQVKKNSGRGK